MEFYPEDTTIRDYCGPDWSEPRYNGFITTQELVISRHVVAAGKTICVFIFTCNVCKRQNNGNSCFLIFQYSIAQWWVSAGVCDDPSSPVRTHHKTPHSGSPLSAPRHHRALLFPEEVNTYDYCQHF